MWKIKIEEARQKLSREGEIKDFKQFSLLEIKEVEGEKDFLTLEFVISDSTIDRAFDVVDVNGWELENYRNNPVVLFAHQSDKPPVAKSLTEWVEDGKLKSRAQFMSREISAFAHSVGQMYKHGFMKAVSVGFKAKEWKFSEDKDRPLGIDFIRQELFEYSCVPVPANPQALVEGAKSLNIDIEPLFKWADELLQTHKNDGFFTPVKDFYKTAKPISISLYRQKNNLLKTKGELI